MPESVSVARASARLRGSPALTPPSAKASTSRATKPGPEPESPVTASMSDSSASCTRPTAASSSSTRARSLAGTSGVWQTTDTPRPIRHGVLGITRTMRRLPVTSASVCSVNPATIETTTASGVRAAENSRQAAAACCGLTARNTILAGAAAAAPLSAKRIPGTRAARRSRAAGTGSCTVISDGCSSPARQKPSASASAICPPPIMAIAGECDGRAVTGCAG